MLKFSDFFHFPKIDALIEQIALSPSGVIIVAGLNPRAIDLSGQKKDLIPGGRRMFFGIIMDEILAANPDYRALILMSDKSALRIPRALRRRTEICKLKSPDLYNEHITQAINSKVNFLVIESLLNENISSAFTAAKQGLRVLTQLDTVLHGPYVSRHLIDLGLNFQDLSYLSWTLSINRLPALCPKCKREMILDTNILEKIRTYYQFLKFGLTEEYPSSSMGYKHLSLLAKKGSNFINDNNYLENGIKNSELENHEEVSFIESGCFYQSSGCDDCQQTGRKGDISVLDIYKASEDSTGQVNQCSILPVESYILHLAKLGYLSVEDFYFYNYEQLRRTFNLLSTTEYTFQETKLTLERKLVELKSANQVLKQRTKALISLQALGQTLIQSTDLETLSREICLRTCDLLGADRIILYYQRMPDDVEILATKGWKIDLEQEIVPENLFYGTEVELKASPYDQYPPGVLDESGDFQANLPGLMVPLVTQNERVGAIIIHSKKRTLLQPKEVALLETIANQTALAIQRAGLFEQLHQKITELESARTELLQKERLEHEMELARQVQLSVLPQTFPRIDGYCFAAMYEPARVVGGDFYDVMLLDKDHIGFAIADVSDKGLAAALYMALTRSLLLAEAHRERSPARVLSNIHRLLKELGNPDLYVTLFYAVLNIKRRTMVYARAGHDRPLLVRKEIIEELPGDGIALAILEADEFSITEYHCQLEPGDRLVLYTDGICDIYGSEGKLFDRSKLKTLIQTCKNLEINEMCKCIFDNLSTFRGEEEQYDDMALLVIEVT
jgi:serine phosphatase RsbU (regulator of sigma subunit)